MPNEPEVSENARRRLDPASGAFEAQEQEPPGLTTAMKPMADHGEETYVGHGKLAGQAALITGGDSGIGRAVAIAYAREGADVAISYLPEEQSDAEETARWVEQAGRTAVLLPGDISEEQTARTIVRDAVAKLARLDILVNNAGVQRARREHGLASVRTEEMDETFKVNLYAMFWITQESLHHLGEGASIINTTSIQAYEPSESLVDYAATKAAILNFTINMAEQLGPQGIRVNAVAPGPIWTPLQPATKPAESMTRFGKNTPLGRAGQPAEVAPAFVFLASPADASYVSGTVLGVTGGRAVG